jgi:DNA repair exonuclease SbcCD ATPase subunit
MAGEPDNLDKQISAVDKLTASIGALTAKFTALVEEGNDWKTIQKEIGSSANKARQDFIDLVKSAEKVAKEFAKDGEAAEGTSERIADLQKKVKSLDSTYSTLVNKTLKELRKEQSAYKTQLKELADQEKLASQQERAIIKERQAAARQALKDIKDRIAQERAEKKRLYDEETKQIQDLLRQQKNRLFEIEQEEKKEKARRRERVSDIKKEGKDIFAQNRLDAKLANEKAAANERAAKAAAAAAERQRFFGKAFADSFSPQSIGKAIGSIVKFIGIYEVLGTVVGGTQRFITSSIQAFIDFDKNISRVAAVTNATGPEIKRLEDSIREIAVETRFTANEISELAIELGKLGVSAKDIPNLLSPVALAAQATGESITAVGSALVKVQNQFQISSVGAASTAATLTSAVNESALTLEDFGVAIGYVGPLASQAGLSFEKTAKILGILSDNGFSASRAGTGLRKILLDLKKPGEDISVTLQTLADKNISVAKAEELVGKTGAAQLITVLRNIDAVNDATLVQEGFAQQLSATARQMSSVSGQLDILSSSFNDLKISFGEFLVSNNLVLNSIGLLSQNSENLARGYVILRNESERLGDAFDKRLADGLKRNNTELEILNELLKDTNDENVKEVLDELNKANPKSLEELNNELERLASESGLLARIAGIIPIFGPALQSLINQFDGLRNAAQGLSGVTGEFTKLRNEEVKRIDLEKGRRSVLRVLKDEVEAIKQITDVKTREIEAQEASQRYLRGAVKLEKEANELLKSSVASERAKGRFLEGRAKAYRELSVSLSEYTGELKKEESVKKDPTDKYLSLFEQERKELDLQLKQIKDRAEEEDKAFSRRKKQIEDEYTLRSENAATISEQAELDAERTEALNENAELYELALVNIRKALEDWDGSSEEFFKKYNSLFKGSEKNTLRLQNVNEQFGQSALDLAQKLTELLIKSERTSSDIANELLSGSGNVFSVFSRGLSDLDDSYSDTAYGQAKLFERQQEYINGLKTYVQQVEAFYDSIKDSLSPEERAKIEAALEAIQSKYNQLANSGITPEENQKDKQEFFELGAAFGENFNLGLDLTIGEGLQMVLDKSIEIIDRFNEVAFENTKNRLDRELDAIKNSAEIEDEILQAKLESQLISEAEYRAQIEKNRKKEVQAQNKIEKQIFEAEQKRDRQKALVDYLSALGSIIPNLILKGEGDPLTISIKAAITSAFASVGYGQELRAINQRQFFPTKFAQGGVVNGPSHAEGGVPFTVRGQGGYEMEGGEYIVNKKSTQKYKTLLDQINGYGKSNYKFAAGGVVKDPAQVANEQVELLRAIASANISMVGKLDKPVRAFVASNDLRSDENARRIQERNSQL